MILYFIIGLLLSFLTIKIIVYFKKNFHPLYFSLSQIIDHNAEDITFISIWEKFIPVVIISFIYSIILKDKHIEYIIFYCFMTSFLIVLPTILVPEDTLTE